jgi:electron transfer flavoprotein alpha subunit
VIAVVVARGGSLVAGSEATIAEAGGVAIVAGEGAGEAAADLAARATDVRAGDECRELRVLELGASFRPGEWAEIIASHVATERVVLLPASPDGRDLAPRLAAVLGRPLLAGAIQVTSEGASVVWRQGRQVVALEAGGPFVATLLRAHGPACPNGKGGGSPRRSRTGVARLRRLSSWSWRRLPLFARSKRRQLPSLRGQRRPGPTSWRRANLSWSNC